jgi:hypothetical protein
MVGGRCALAPGLSIGADHFDITSYRRPAPERRTAGALSEEWPYRDKATGRHRYTDEIIVDCRHAADDLARQVKPQTPTGDDGLTVASSRWSSRLYELQAGKLNRRLRQNVSAARDLQRRGGKLAGR